MKLKVKTILLFVPASSQKNSTSYKVFKNKITCTYVFFLLTFFWYL